MGVKAVILLPFLKKIVELEQGFEDFPNVVGDEAVAGGVGVDAVGLVEAGDAADVLEEEGDEGAFVFCGEGGEDVAEGIGVGGAHRWGHLHSGEDDLCRGVFGLDGVDDGLEIGGGAGDGNSTEAVIGAELEDEDVCGGAQDPVDAAVAVGGGFAADAGVDDLPGEVEGIDAVLDDGGKGLAGGDAIAGGEAVAEEDDMFLGPRLEGGHQGQEH